MSNIESNCRMIAFDFVMDSQTTGDNRLTGI